MHASSVHLFLVLAFTCCAAWSCVAAESDESNGNEKISAAVDKGVAYLKSQQKQDGSWADGDGDLFDRSPLCTWALLRSGVAADDECIQKALGYLRNRKPQRLLTKVEALSTIVFCEAEPKNDAARIKKNVKLLVDSQIQEGDSTGGWGYVLGDDSSKQKGDASNAEWAVLALDHAHALGFAVEPSLWPKAARFWQSRQQPNGSWGYRARKQGTGSMTCTGLASLGLVKSKLEDASDKLQVQTVVKAGTRWLEINFTVARNPPREQVYHLYYLYVLSRTARSQGLKKIDDRDWYREAAETLLEKQNQKTGAWFDHFNAMTDTSIALLVLSPVAD